MWSLLSCSLVGMQMHSPNLPARIIPTLHEGRYPGLAGRMPLIRLGAAETETNVAGKTTCMSS